MFSTLILLPLIVSHEKVHATQQSNVTELALDAWSKVLHIGHKNVDVLFKKSQKKTRYLTFFHFFQAGDSFKR